MDTKFAAKLFEAPKFCVNLFADVQFCGNIIHSFVTIFFCGYDVSRQNILWMRNLLLIFLQLRSFVPKIFAATQFCGKIICGYDVL